MSYSARTSMSRTKTAKFIILDIIQWGAYASPVFVTGTMTAQVRSNVESEYWLLVALVIAYVAAATLLVWIPVKLVFQWLRLVSFQKGKWCPSMLLYVVLSALPCTVMILVSTHTQPTKDFHAHCIELMVVMLVLSDLTEKLKRFKLRAAFDPDTSGLLTEIGETTGAEYQGSVSGYSLRRRSSQASLVTSSRHSNDRKPLAWTDPRPWVIMRCVLNAYDVRLVMELAHNSVTPNISYTNWIYAIYIIALCGMCTFVLKPKNHYSSFVSVTFLEIPFFFLRFAYLCHYGHVISILFFLKNLLAAGSFIYFNLALRFLYGSEKPFGQININTIDRSLPNGTLGQRPSTYPTRIGTTNPNYTENHVTSRTAYDVTDKFNYQAYALSDNAPAEQQHQPQPEPAYSHESDEHEFDTVEHYDDHYGYPERENYAEDGMFNWKRKGPYRDTVLKSDLYETPEPEHHEDYQTQQRQSHLQEYNDGNTDHNHSLEHTQYASTSTAEPQENTEPTYSAINYKAKAASRKKHAPAAPSSQRKQDSEPTNRSGQQQSSFLHSQLQEQPSGMVEINVGPQRVSVRKDLRYTPAVAAQIAKEASNAVARDAVAVLDNVVENLDEDNTSSQSSYNARL